MNRSSLLSRYRLLAFALTSALTFAALGTSFLRADVMIIEGPQYRCENACWAWGARDGCVVKKHCCIVSNDGGGSWDFSGCTDGWQ